MTAHPLTGFSLAEALSGLADLAKSEPPRVGDLVGFCGYAVNRSIDAILVGANDGPIPLSWPLAPLKRNLTNIRNNERRKPWPDLNRIALCTGVLTEIEAFEKG